MEEKNYGIVGWTYEHITKPLGRFSRKALKGVSGTFKKVTKPAVDFIKKKVIDPVIINPVKKDGRIGNPRPLLAGALKIPGTSSLDPAQKRRLSLRTSRSI